jgi:gliding motility-associated-like protein
MSQPIGTDSYIVQVNPNNHPLCVFYDTVNITVIGLVNAGLDTTINLCKEGGTIDLFTMLNGNPDTGGTWYDPAGNQINPIILPDTVTSGTVFKYFIGINGCSDSSYVTVNVIQVTASLTVVDSDCNACNGEITVNPQTFYGNISDIAYSINSGTAQASNIFPSLCGGAPTGSIYNILIQDSLGCQTSIIDTVIDINFPVIDVNSIVLTDSDCGLNNGEVISVTTNGGTPNYNYLIENLTTPFQPLPIQNLPPSSPTHNLIVEDAFGCTDTVAITINEINQPVIIDTTIISNICNGGANGSIEIIGNNLAYYSIDNGNTIQTSNVFNNLPAGNYSVIAYSSDPSITNACSDTLQNITISEPNALDVFNLTPSSTICPNETIIISADSSGGNGNAVLNWTINGVLFSSQDTSITLQPSINTQVCVEITEANCPTDIECTTIALPTPIVPSFSVDEASGCVPLQTVFTNTSTNQNDIQIVNWDFGGLANVNSNSTVNFSFEEPGVYDVYMTVTSIYNCVYDTTYSQLIEVYELPTADFTSNPRPANVYETDINFQDLSSDDVVSWSWDLGIGASPRYSGEENPETSYPIGVPGVYPVMLAVTNSNNCVDTIISQVEIINDVTIFAPNVFTPDEDEFNQTWRVYISGIDIYDFHLTIFNRWGEIVWESYDPNAEWKGAYGANGDVMDGTYVWVLNTKDSYTDKKYEFRGTVSILR